MRRMFGKTGVFCDGVMLAMVRDNTLYFRVDDENRVTFKEAESFPPLNYEKKGGVIDLSFLARSGAIVRRIGRACRLGASGAGGGAARCRAERTRAERTSGAKTRRQFAAPHRKGAARQFRLIGVALLPASPSGCYRSRSQTHRGNCPT
jgi:TfoX N-terminal domain